MNSARQPLLFLTGLFLLTSVMGCGDGTAAKIASVTKHHVKKVAIMYKAFSNDNKFKGPANEEELKAWAQDDKVAERLGKFGVDVSDFDSYMTSDVTGEKLEILWGIKSAPMAPPYPVVIESPVDGVRKVGMAGGQTIEISSDEEYEEIKAGNYESGKKRGELEFE